MLGWLPENISSYGGKIDSVMRLIYYTVGAWFLLAEGVLFAFIVFFRKREGRVARYLPGNNIKSLLWVLIPAALVLVFDLGIDHFQSGVWKEVKQDLPIAEQKVLVRGRQFVWEFAYAGQDGRFDTPDDITAMNHLYVPVDQNIHLQLESADVLHSFWVPSLRFKQDLVPGRSIMGWFRAVKKGDYQIACAELCGVGHGNMGGWLHVLSSEDFEKWKQENRP